MFKIGRNVQRLISEEILSNYYGGRERGCTCEQYRPLDLEGKGEQGAEAHSIGCGHKDVGVGHGGVVLVGWNCLLPRPQGKVPAMPCKGLITHFSEAPDAGLLKGQQGVLEMLKRKVAVQPVRQCQGSNSSQQ